jgi:hypothetical protein
MARLLGQRDGNLASAAIRARPWPLHRGQRASASATAIGKSGSRRFIIKSISPTSQYFGDLGKTLFRCQFVRAYCVRAHEHAGL